MPDEIVPDVYDITVRDAGDSRYRVFLFDGDPPTLVDAGFGDTVDAVVEAVDDLGVAPERLAITHGHGDHAGGFDGLADAFDLETWVPEGTDLDASRDPDHRYADGDAVGRFTAIHTPGHTPHHHSLVDEDAGVAVLGDAAFGANFRGLPAGHFVLPPGFYSADVDAADESLERLLPFEFDAGLLYHGSSVTEDAREKLDRFVNHPGRA